MCKVEEFNSSSLIVSPAVWVSANGPVCIKQCTEERNIYLRVALNTWFSKLRLTTEFVFVPPMLLFHLYPFLTYFLSFRSFSSSLIFFLFLLLFFPFPLYRIHSFTLLIFLFCFSSLISYSSVLFLLCFMDGGTLQSEHQRINFLPHCKKIIITLCIMNRSLSH
jgi:hypothetical protein